jgi:arylsulfatase A-like enzyme
MAAQGVRLTSFYAGAPFCSPSRAALLTGRYPVRAGVPNVLFPTETTGLPPAEITLAEMLKPAGYVTGAIGKWHLGWPKELRAQRQGFDFFYGLPYSNDMYQVGPDEELRAQHARWDLPLLEDDEVLEAPVEQHTLTERYTERALRFIRSNRERPFFLYLPHTFPHSPLYAAKDREGRSPHGLYADVVEELDDSTGRILDLLAELGLDERTLVIFTSDNGSHETAPDAKGRFGVRGAGGDNGRLKGRKGNTFLRGACAYRGSFGCPAESQPGGPRMRSPHSSTFCPRSRSSRGSSRPPTG